MISVSERWKELNGQTLLPEMFVEINYSITDPSLHEEADVTATTPEAFSNEDQIVDGAEKNSESYSNLDYGTWGLDGSYTYFDGTPVDPGYVYSGYSDSNGSFEVPPEIVINFETRYMGVIPGLTITWDDAFGCWASEFLITVSNSNGIILQRIFQEQSSPVSKIVMDMSDFSQIKIKILKWSHPFQRAKCSNVFLGINSIYTKDDLLGFTHKQSVDLLSAALPVNDITFKLRNDDDRWNPDSPMGSEKYLAERQQVTVRYGMDVDGEVEWIKGGTYWLSGWNTPSNGMEADFTAKNAIEFMGATYGGARVGTLYSIAVTAFEEADLPTSSGYIVDESLKNIETDFSNDETDYRISEVLQLVAHAGNCVFYQDRDGIVRIEPWKRVYSDNVVDPNISYTHPEYTFNKPLKAVSVEYGSDRQSVVLNHNSIGEVQTVSNPLVITMEDAARVGKKTLEILENRKVVSGDFRADLRMDALDSVIVTSKYATNVVGITDVEYSTTGGAFRGKYTGRVVSIKLDPVEVYSNEFYSNEIW